MKKFIGLFIIILAVIFFFREERNDVVIEKPVKEQTRREIASLPPIPDMPKKMIMKAEETVSRDITSTNKEATKLEQKIIDHYSQVFEEVETKVSLEYMQTIILEEDAHSSSMQVYKVSLDQGLGNKSRFLAMIDPETGSIVKTWNHTRYEFKRPLRISGEGQEFYADF